jgi:hypothetical protein
MPGPDCLPHGPGLGRQPGYPGRYAHGDDELWGGTAIQVQADTLSSYRSSHSAAARLP